MTLIDASALVAILQAEPEVFDFIEFLEANDVSIPASALVEAEILALRRGLGSDLERLIVKLNAHVIGFDHRMVPLAAEAFRQYGKGRHKAGLNFGDCLVYATAKHLNLPLLFKGQDFIHTDLRPARSVSH